ncbi:MAG TPA: hypothetical protein VJH24_04165 [Candidatus Bilamarchaeaceae archaeon]|nr:hypothetical protein [Candidatus Bilamarchaeaceae archaeon]
MYECMQARLAFGATLTFITNSKPRRSRIVDEQLLSEILRLHFIERFSIRKTANILGLSHMTVHRALSNERLALVVGGSHE